MPLKIAIKRVTSWWGRNKEAFVGTVGLVMEMQVENWVNIDNYD